MPADHADEAPSHQLGPSEPSAEAHPAASLGTPPRVLDNRLDDIVGTIVAYASLRFEARAPIGPAGDLIDAVAAGVNYLGEELGASFGEMERRVADRTAELAIATQELSRRALHDDLTGLPNRALLWEHLVQRRKVANRRQTSFAVLFLDLDDFKVINDSFGHAAGDQLLRGVASRIGSALRVGDTAARVGGDEFVVLLDDVATDDAAMATAQRLSEALRAPYEIGTESRIVTASIGVAVGAEGLVTADDVLAAADTAMYDAKRQGGGRCVLYHEGTHGTDGMLG